MSTATELSKPDKVLVAALNLGGGGIVTAESLVVQAWKEDRLAFGLAGYSEIHPDANKVLTNLMGARGLVAKGLMEKMSPKVYQLTQSGRDRAKMLRDE